VAQLDFEFVLFSSAIIDYDYIMSLISKFTQSEPKKQKMNREQLINMLCATANLMEEREDIIDYINTLKAGEALNEKEIKDGYQQFKTEKAAKEMTETAQKYGLAVDALQSFVDEIIDRMVFDGEKLSDLTGTARTGLERTNDKGTGTDGRHDTAAKETCRWA
jgi:type I restriction enzyme R subunit